MVWLASLIALALLGCVVRLSCLLAVREVGGVGIHRGNYASSNAYGNHMYKCPCPNVFKWGGPMQMLLVILLLVLGLPCYAWTGSARNNPELDKNSFGIGRFHLLH